MKTIERLEEEKNRLIRMASVEMTKLLETQKEKYTDDDGSLPSGISFEDFVKAADNRAKKYREMHVECLKQISDIERYIYMMKSGSE